MTIPVEIEGGTAQVRDRVKLGTKKYLTTASSRFVEALNKKEKVEGESRTTEESSNAWFEYNMVVVLNLVESWTLPEVLPKSREEWYEFEDSLVFDELSDACRPVAEAIINGVRFDPTKKSEADPTGGSSDSKGPGSEARILSTEPQDGSSTSTRSTASAA